VLRPESDYPSHPPQFEVFWAADFVRDEIDWCAVRNAVLDAFTKEHNRKIKLRFLRFCVFVSGRLQPACFNTINEKKDCCGTLQSFIAVGGRKECKALELFPFVLASGLATPSPLDTEFSESLFVFFLKTLEGWSSPSALPSQRTSAARALESYLRYSRNHGDIGKYGASRELEQELEFQLLYFVVTLLRDDIIDIRNLATAALVAHEQKYLHKSFAPHYSPLPSLVRAIHLFLSAQKLDIVTKFLETSIFVFPNEPTNEVFFSTPFAEICSPERFTSHPNCGFNDEEVFFEQLVLNAVFTSQAKAALGSTVLAPGRIKSVCNQVICAMKWLSATYSLAKPKKEMVSAVSSVGVRSQASRWIDGDPSVFSRLCSLLTALQAIVFACLSSPELFPPQALDIVILACNTVIISTQGKKFRPFLNSLCVELGRLVHNLRMVVVH
jgi:hypothetical protein